MLTWIDRTETEYPTGIGRYNQALLERLPNHVVNIEPSKKIEVDIRGKKFGGYISRIMFNALGSFDSEIVHAPDIFQLHRDCDTCMIHDFELIDNPEKMGVPESLWNWHLKSIEDLDAIFCPSGKTARGVIERDLAHPENVHIVPHGIDSSTFYPQKKIRSGQYVEDWAVLVGRYQPRKRWDKLAEFDEIPVNIFRVGPEDREASEELREIVESRGAKFTDYGYISEQRMRELITSAKMVLHPADNEGFGFIPLEAAACGTPTMCQPLDIYKETIGDLTIPWDLSFQEALKMAGEIESKYLRAKASQFSWQDSVRKHIQVWSELR